MSSRFYDVFHSSTKIQRAIITRQNFTYYKIIRAVEKYIKKDDVVLDIGCGSGSLDYYLANKVRFVYGIDISENAISICKKTAKNLGISNVSFETMDFPKVSPKKQFDFIICSEVLEHIEDDEGALRRIYSILKKRGTLIISVPSQDAPLYRLGLLKKFDKEVGHVRRYKVGRLNDKLEKIGFKVIEVNKIEGILRNLLYTNKRMGFTIKFLKSFISDFTMLIDDYMIKLFGESNFIIVVKKM